jgi:hypothetical protein
MPVKFMDKVLAVKTRDEARALVDREVQEIVGAWKEASPSPEKVANKTELLRRRVLSNIGYLAGYMNEKAGNRILDLFETEHPFFGREHPGPEQALAIGKRYGKLTRTKQGRAKMVAFMDAGDYAALRRWIGEGICPQCFALLDEVAEEDCPNAIHKSGRRTKREGTDNEDGSAEH